MSLEAHKGQILPLVNTTIPLSSSTIFHAPFDNTLWGYNASTAIKPLGFSNALAFNGTDTYVPLDYGKNLSIEPMTIEMWVRPNAVALQQRIFSITDTVGNKLSVGWSSAKWDMAIGTSGFLSPVGTVSVNALAWSHVAIVLNASTATLYVNGSLVISKAYTTWTLSSNITLGCLVGTSSNSDFFDGQMSDVRIWSTARTVAQITANYDTEFTMDQAGLVRYFKLNQNEGSLVQDYSTNGSTCKVQGLGPTIPEASLTTNFVGKVEGSVVENPHIHQFAVQPTLLDLASVLWYENSQDNINQTMALDGVCNTDGVSGSGIFMQHLFSFNLIEAIYRRYGEGTIQGADSAAKVAWLKTNIAVIRCNWHGFGSGPSGDKATVNFWSSKNKNWTQYAAISNTSNTPSLLSKWSANVSDAIDQNGFVHVLAYADASNGTIDSTINTDYVEFVIEFKSPFKWTYGRTVATIKPAQGKYRGAVEIAKASGSIPKGALHYPESLFPLDAFTFNAWFNLYQHDTTSYQPIFEYYDKTDTTKNRILLMFDTTADSLSLFVTSASGASSGINGSWTPSVNAWHMVTLVYDGTNYKIYGDGQLKHTSGTGNKPTRTANHRFNLGGDAFGSLNGLLEDVRIDNRAVSEDEIIAWYYSGGSFTSFASPNIAY